MPLVSEAQVGRASSDADARAHWRTPPALVRRCADLAGVDGWDLDAAAVASSSVAPEYLGPDHVDPARRDALVARWGARNVWLNPPYLRSMAQWAARAARAVADGECGVVGVLAFARTDTEWWSIAWEAASEVYFFRRRVRFLRPDGTPGDPAPAPSALIVLRRRVWLAGGPTCVQVVDQ